MYEGSICMIQGKTYLVNKLSLEEKKASVHPVEVPYFTSAVKDVAIRVIG